MKFDQVHPAVNLLFFLAVLVTTFVFRHPVYIAVSFCSAFAYNFKCNKVKGLIFNIVLIPLAVLFGYYYSSYHHFGMTVLGYNFTGNRLTLESLVYGIVLGFMLAAALMWFGCLFAVFTTDKIVYLFGVLSPLLSLLLSVLLRIVPRIIRESGRMDNAQGGIGLSVKQGHIGKRIWNGLCIFSMTISWTIGALARMSDSIQMRGGRLKKRTAFSIYRFDNRDRSLVVFFFFCIAVTLLGWLLKQTDMIYDPRIIWMQPTVLSYLFYVCFAALCLMPLVLELWTEHSFEMARKKRF